MRILLRWGTLVIVAGLLLAVAEPARSQKPAAKKTLTERLADDTKLAPKDIEKVLRALGPAIRDELAAGETVQLPNLGTFRVVRVAEHRDLIDGRPGTVPATNNVEFLPTGDVVRAANSASAVPAETVPAFQYNPFGVNRDSGLKSGQTRTTGTRTR